MITYLYRTNTTFGEVNDMNEARCALDVLENSKSEDGGGRKDRACIEVTDSGEHHDGLALTIQAYVEGTPVMDKWKDKLPKKMYKSWFDICHMYLSPRQGRELIEAIQHALDMRKYDDENEEEDNGL